VKVSSKFRFSTLDKQLQYRCHSVYEKRNTVHCNLQNNVYTYSTFQLSILKQLTVTVYQLMSLIEQEQEYLPLVEHERNTA
jgi:hypothetical protein